MISHSYKMEAMKNITASVGVLTDNGVRFFVQTRRKGNVVGSTWLGYAFSVRND